MGWGLNSSSKLSLSFLGRLEQRRLKIEGAAGTKARSADSWVGGGRKPS